MAQPAAVTALIDQGLAAHGAGDIDGARAKFAEAVNLAPNDPEALHLLGLACEMQKERTEALSLIERAVAMDPREPIFRMNFAAILQKERRFDEAVVHVQAALKEKPQASDIWALSGQIELARNNADVAAQHFRRAFELDGRNADALAGYGRAVLLAGATQDAMRALQTAQHMAPTSIEVQRLALDIVQRTRNGRMLAQTVKTWRKVKKGDDDSLGELARILFDFGYWAEAKDVYSEVAADSHDAQVLAAYGRYCTAARDYGEAESVLEKALALSPASANALFAMSRLKYYTGDMAAAENLNEKAVENNPRHLQALRQLADLRGDRMNDDHLATMQSIASDQKTRQEDAYQLLMALGNVYHARGDAEEAFSFFSAGNEAGERELKQTGFSFEREQARRQTKLILKTFAAARPACNFPLTAAAPIFVVGMPRSGTTLTESILAAHPDVCGAGEITRLPTILQDILVWVSQSPGRTFEDASPDQLQHWRDQYLSSLPKADGARFIVDKQPLNFQAAGLIRTILPEAKIVHIRRNPVETGFSIFRQPFNRHWAFSHQLDDIAFYYGEYARIMDHWRAAAVGDILLIQYETLVENFEQEARRLLGHCDLDWRDDISAFHETSRPIATFSAMQVRQPIKTNSADALALYGGRLSPLVEGLKRANVDLTTGALLP